MSFVGFLRTIHGWLGFFVMPWIIVIGLTGFYLNHSKTIYEMLPNGSYDEKLMDEWLVTAPVSAATALKLASTIWPNEAVISTTEETYHQRPSYVIEKDSGRIIVTKATGHFWVKSEFTRLTFNPDGALLNKKRYWSNIFKAIHTDGWINSYLGSFLADATALAMVVFGASGIFMFLIPRMRGNKNNANFGGHSKRATPRPMRVRPNKNF